MLNFFRKKQNKKTLNLENPSVFFSMLGPTMSEMWNNFVEGENQAVDLYFRYFEFKTMLNQKYSDIDFDRKLTQPDNRFPDITAGECMYLKMLDLTDNIYLSFDYNTDNVLNLTIREYNNLISQLTPRESSYCTEMKKFCDNYIKSLVNEVSEKLYDIKLLKNSDNAIPLNTLECVNYHKYLAEENYFEENNIHSSWNRIYKAPIVSIVAFKKISQNNPLIPSNIKNLGVHILDYICYGTIALPCMDMDKVLQSKSPSSDKTILQTIAEVLGDGADQYVERIIVDMNCYNFRRMVRNGLKIK